MINSIHKLPLFTFIDCICDNDLSGLGDGSQEERIVVWNDILEQYSDAMQDDGNKRYIIAVKNYHQAKIRYEMANSYIELLNNYFRQGAVVKKWIIDLNKLVGASYSFDSSKPELFTKYLDSCFKRNKGNLIAFNLAQTKLEEILNVQAKGDTTKYDRAYFTKVLVNLKDMKSREIPDTISTYEFCVLVNHYKQYLEQHESTSKRK